MSIADLAAPARIIRHEKVDPALLNVLEDFESEGDTALLDHKAKLGVSAALGEPRPASAVVFIRCAPRAELGRAREAGVILNQSSGEIRTALVPLHQVGTLTEDDEVDRVVASRILRPLMDVACPRVNFPAYRTRTGLSGKGVIVGVIDTGIDTRHPAFGSRISRVWDQTVPGPGTAAGKYGIELKGTKIAASRDVEGHGTHVAGIAAGSDAVYTGMAPDAEIVVVKTSFQTAHIADGVRFIAGLARKANRPAVINLSLGGHADAHDGTDELSAIIDRESGPGVIVCCAAGNEGNDNIHAQAQVASAGTHRMRFSVPANTVSVATLNGWYDGTARLEVAVSSPGGFITPFQPVIGAGNPSRSYDLPDARVRITTPEVDPANGDLSFSVDLRARSGPLVKGGAWQLHLRNPGQTPATVDVWTLDGLRVPQVIFTGTSVSDSVKIGSPGCSRSAVTVGSYTTRASWTDIDGVTREVRLTADDISDFSSEGPLRDGTPKPDLAAPGAMIVSALSAFAAPERPSMISPDHLVEAGTSMATPFVSGLVALMLQQDPTRDPVQVKTLLQNVCTLPPTITGGNWDPKWGSGLLDVLSL